MERPNEDEIRRRAYELYQSRGEEEGSDTDDWLAAERELREGRSASAGEPPADQSRNREPTTDESSGRESSGRESATRGPATRGSAARGSGSRGGARRGPTNGPDSQL